MTNPSDTPKRNTCASKSSCGQGRWGCPCGKLVAAEIEAERLAAEQEWRMEFAERMKTIANQGEVEIDTASVAGAVVVEFTAAITSTPDVVELLPDCAD